MIAQKNPPLLPMVTITNFMLSGKNMVKATNLGYPRIGSKRETKKALEGY